MFNLSDYDYDLPKDLIAQAPMEPRDHSRLLVLQKKVISAPAVPSQPDPEEPPLGAEERRVGSAQTIEHRHFFDLVDYLQSGDVLVLNDTKVFPARLIGRRVGSGGKVEVFLLRRLNDDHPPFGLAQDRPRPLQRGNRNSPLEGSTPVAPGGGVTSLELWQCLVGGHRAPKGPLRGKVGLAVEFAGGLTARVEADNGDGTFTVAFNMGSEDLMRVVNIIGQTPLPPYISRPSATLGTGNRQQATGNTIMEDKERYQTVYADEGKPGSVAAPTAGLHFTPELLDKLKAKGVTIEYITLHVGLGTFAAVKTEDIREHKMHAEWVEATPETMARIYEAKNSGKRVIAVGTTTIRTLEAMVSEFPISNFQFQKNIQYPISNDQNEFIEQFPGFSKFVNIFIYPGYEFKIVDGMITNFHLPKSTLLMLVSAFAGKENIDRAYREAIKERYRFYSYGDAMLII